jgi:hypothetical protein
MTEVEIADGHLRVVVEGFDKVLALKSTLEVPPHPRPWRLPSARCTPRAARPPLARHVPTGDRRGGATPH